MRILVTPLFGLGDTLLFTPALKVLKENKPNFILDVFVFKKSIYDILRHNPYIDNLIYQPLLSWGKLKTLHYILTSLRGKYDITINFFPSNRKDYNLFAYLTGAKVRLGHRYWHSDLKELNFLKNLTIKENKDLHCVEENINLIKLLDINLNGKEIPKMQVYLTQEEIKHGLNFLKQWDKKAAKIGVHAGSSSFKNHYNKRWPKENFLTLVNYFKKAIFFLFGTDEEKEVNEFISKNSKYKNVVLVENKGIREVAAIIKNLDLFISNDSGLMHLAAAVGTKTIGIFGPTNPTWVRPWGKKHIVIKPEGISCAPCFVYSPKPLQCKNKDKWICLKSITPERVINLLKAEGL
ncbi:glycosyltransferase family 9 protein [Desulfonauticus submarinus]